MWQAKLAILSSTARICAFALLFLSISTLQVSAAAAPSWQAEWEKTLAAAEKEGQVTVYGPPGINYQDAIGSFQNSFPKIKLVYVAGSGTVNAQRLVTERRAGKFLADAFIGGSGSIIDVLFDGNMLEPIPPMLVLPEVRDQSLWFNKTHIYADAKGQHVFMMMGNVNSNIAAYNTKITKPEGLKSHLDLLHPKWKGKIVAYDPRARGHIQNVRALYHNPKLGGEFFRRFFSETDVTLSRDQRLMIDWVAQGKYELSVFSSNNDVFDAKRKGLPIDIIDAPDDESYMSGGFGHVGIVNKTPHPAAAKIFLNWLLSKEGQLRWQEKANDNSLRTDIPKHMLSDQAMIPKEKGRYMNTSLPQYQDIDVALKIVDDALAKAGKK
ncbi:MAG: extracellular solute-binding protein [Deltaproteobacteria bacterium]|nr:extracellular solute-binding protein [Deltaproteobacteria bacterium]